MKIQRDFYLQKLIRKKHNGTIKIVSGIRRCGKSYLLYKLFRQHLIESGTDEGRIISVALDSFEGQEYRDPAVFYNYVKSRIHGEAMHYLLLDEVQMMRDFESVLNGLLRVENLDIYVTGSNSRFLSTDVITEFRGRGDEVRVHPLSFAEYHAARGIDWRDAWEEYRLYGGMPQLFIYDTEAEKMQYLSDLFRETYIKDIIERNRIKNNDELEEMLNIIASGIGCLFNPNKLANSFRSLKNVQLSPPTIKLYLDYLENAFVIDKALRYDIKGNKYISTPYKYYFADMGLRNARLNFRQSEETHAMENIIYNELIMRGYKVDVGMVELLEKNAENLPVRKKTEVDFVANMGSKRLYIQSALTLPTKEKREQEERSLLAIRDSFKKVLIVKDGAGVHYDDAGVLILNLKDFLLNPDSIRE